MQSDGNNIQAVYDIKDENLSNNIIKNELYDWSDLDKEFKLRLQQYNNRMNRNKTYIEK